MRYILILGGVFLMGMGVACIIFGLDIQKESRSYIQYMIEEDYDSDTSKETPISELHCEYDTTPHFEVVYQLMNI